MAGRGRSATLPAWMTQNGNGGQQITSSNSYGIDIIDNQRIELPKAVNNEINRATDEHERNNDRNRSTDKTNRSDSRSKDRSARDRRKSKSRSRSRDRSRRDTSKRSRSPSNELKDYRRKGKPSNFDITPPGGIEPVGVGLISQSSNTVKFPDELVSHCLARYTGLVNSSKASNYNLLQTQNARRLYVGGITADTVETDLSKFFVETIRNAVYSTETDVNDPVIQVYINREKCFAFVELRSVELTSACCNLDGIKFTNRNDVTVTLRIRRPNDFKPELLQGISLSPTPRVDLQKLGMVSTAVATESVERIFVGGLPYHLTDDSVKELLAVFGPLKSFHLVRDPGSITSKGYGFCEYFDNNTSQVAIQGLNGMAIADKNLTVKFASAQNNLQSAALLPTSGLNINMIAQPPIPSSSYSGQSYNSSLSLMTIHTIVPTRVLLLGNMITSNELNDDQEYGDIMEDVGAECMAFGQVNSVIAPRRKDGYATEGNIYVEFLNPIHAQKCAGSLIGRKFADRTVSVSYYDESLFNTKQFI